LSAAMDLVSPACQRLHVQSSTDYSRLLTKLTMADGGAAVSAQRRRTISRPRAGTNQSRGRRGSLVADGGENEGYRCLCANPHHRQWTTRRAVQVNRSSSNAGCASLARGNLTDKLLLLAKQMFEVPSSRMHLTSLHLL
jgi:hypothetical protein